MREGRKVQESVYILKIIFPNNSFLRSSKVLYTALHLIHCIINKIDTSQNVY